jgi:predicted Zn-dependent protease
MSRISLMIAHPKLLSEVKMHVFVRCTLWLCLLCPAYAFAQRPPISEPIRRDAVIDVLPSGYAALMPRAEEGAARAPGSVADAEALIATAARSGDARLIGRAEKILERHRGPRETPAVLRARAYIAQYRHDFETALALLDQAIARNPRDADSRLSRAQIMLVGGEVERARRECTALAVGTPRPPACWITGLHARSRRARPHGTRS